METRGKKPSWGGFVPQFLGREVCQEMRAILTGDDDYPFLDAPAKTSLASLICGTHFGDTNADASITRWPAADN